MASDSDGRTIPPGDLLVRIVDGVWIREHGRLVAGGVPFRLLRLAPGGADRVLAWQRGPTPVGADRATRQLARRLLDAGILEAVPVPATDLRHVAVVVPVRDRADQLDRCLAALRATAPEVPVLVVDDASQDAPVIAAVGARHGARIVRLESNGGPSAARNAGIAATAGEVVAFVDSDVEVDDGWLQTLVGHLADPRVGAAAPRVAAAGGLTGVLGEYERRRSSLDMGSRAGHVGPGQRVSHVPAATLVVRRSSLPPGGFDETLRLGEDVDLVWRMVEAGWLVVYEPRATVRHDHRVRVGAFIRRRRDYAMSIAPLARRHPHALPAVRGDVWSLATVTLAATAHPVAAMLAVATRWMRLRTQLSERVTHPGRLAADLVVAGTVGGAHSAAHAVRRTWLPAILVLALRRRKALRILAAAEILRYLGDRRPVSAPEAALAVVDDVIAALGTWEGCLRHRTIRPLLPAFARPRAR